MTFATRNVLPRNPFTDLAAAPRTRESFVQVRLLRALYFGGVLRAVGSIVTVSEFDANNLTALKRAEIVI